MDRADEQAYEVESSVLWADGCVTKCLENDKELFAPSVCRVLWVYVSAGDTAYGGASGYMLFPAVKMQITKIAVYFPPFYLGT